MRTAAQEGRDRVHGITKMKSVRAARLAAGELVLPLARDLERLTLVCEAMWSLLREKTELTEKDLAARMTELDLDDGHADGKRSRPPRDCPECGSKICRAMNRCLFCGHVPPDTEVFDQLRRG